MQEPSILVVCIGNICRSPMAEALLRDACQRQNIAARIGSAGLRALVDHNADPLACELMRERSLDIEAHRARQFDGAMGAQHDLLLVMESDQQRVIESRWPLLRGRVARLGHWGDFDIDDPYRQPKDQFALALESIEGGVADWSARLTELFNGRF